MRLGIDLDGVVYDFHETFRLWCSSKYKTDLTPTYLWTDWNFWNLWNIRYSEEQLLADFEEACVEHGVLWYKGAVLDGASEALTALSETDHEVVIVTHRPEYAEEATLAWLERKQIPYDEINFASNGDKTVYGLDLLLDDRPENLEASAAIDEIAVCFDRPWNQPTNDASNSRWTGDRVNWDSFLGYVESVGVVVPE